MNASVNSSPMLTLEDLTAQGYDTVIVAAPDMTGQLLGKRMTPAKFAEFIDRGVAMSACTFGWDVVQDIGPEFPYAGWHTGWRDFLLIPDMQTLRPAAWLKRTAIVMCDIIEEHDRTPVEITPRQILKRQVEQLAKDGYAAKVGTELEFHMYRDSYLELRERGYRDREPATVVHADYKLQQVNTWEPFFQHVRECLDASGLNIEMSQGEWGLGQFEINLVYGDPVDMCDRHAIYKLAIKDLAEQAGLSVTFMPKPNTGEVGSSCHIHVSIQNPSASGDAHHVFWDPAGQYHMSQTFRHALGGVLEHAPDLMLFYAPTINSYKRTNSSEFAGRGATWGHDNRTASCRILGTSPSSVRFEWRVPGADVNPYLAVAGLLASSRSGLAHQTDPGPAREGDVYQQEVSALFPQSLGESVGAFGSSAFTRDMLTPPVVEQYVIAGRWEDKLFRESVTDWEHVRYFEII